MLDALDKPLTADRAGTLLNKGLELVVARTQAYWQKPGRAALRFLTDREAAQEVIGELRSEYHVRRSSRQTVLTPERIESDEDREPGVLYMKDMSDDWIPAKKIVERLGCSAGTVPRWWRRGEVEGVKARGPSVLNLMIRDDERLQQKIERYKSSRYA